MPPGPQPPAKEKRNWPGLLGGIAGVLLSLGAAVIAANVAALAFGFEATQKGYGAVALIAGSVISAVMAAPACLVMVL